MQLRTVRSAVLFVTLVLAGSAFGQDAAPSRETGSVSASAPKPFEQIVRLWQAKLSEEFLLRKIERETVVYRLSTDDIIACKAAGLPESIIEAMMKTEGRAAPAGRAPAPPVAGIPPAPPAPTAPPAVVAAVPPSKVAPPVPAIVPEAAPPVAPPAPAAPVVAVAPAAAVPVPPVPASPGLAAQADRSWDGIVMRSPGVVLFKNPWQQGSLSFRSETLSWRDAGDESKNVVLAAAAIREHFLVCPKDAPSDESCFEWGVKTADAEFRFRDVAWQREDSPKPRELFTFLEALYPDLARERYRVVKKK